MEYVPVRGRFKPHTTFGILFVHAVAGYALWYQFTTGFSAAAWWTFALMWAIRSQSVTLANHRYVTHQAFECSPTVERVLLALVCTCVQGSSMWWAQSHAQHHAYSDQPGDPHRPSEYGGGWTGFWWSHMGWLFYQRITPPPDYTPPPRLRDDPALRWQKRYYWPFAVGSFVFVLLFAGWEGLLLASFLGLALSWHVTWSVNSVTHIIGDEAMDRCGRVIDSRSARNFPLWCLFYTLAILSGGELWHANHHGHPGWAYFSWKPHQFDPGAWTLRLAEKLHLVWDVNKPRFVS